MCCLQPCTPIIATGPCPPTVAGPYAAWMPRKSLQGRTCGVSRDGGQARTLQPSHRSTAPRLSYRMGDCFKRPTISTGPCPPTVARPYAAWIPRKSLQGRTCGVSRDGGRARALQQSRRSTARRLSYRMGDCCKRPTISTGPCPPTVAGPYAAWTPRKSLQGRTCGVSREGGRARALQPRSRSAAPQVIYPYDASLKDKTARFEPRCRSTSGTEEPRHQLLPPHHYHCTAESLEPLFKRLPSRHHGQVTVAVATRWFCEFCRPKPNSAASLVS